MLQDRFQKNQSIQKHLCGFQMTGFCFFRVHFIHLNSLKAPRAGSAGLLRQTDDGHALPVLLVGFVEFSVMSIVFLQFIDDFAVLFIHGVLLFCCGKAWQRKLYTNLSLSYFIMEPPVLHFYFIKIYLKKHQALHNIPVPVHPDSPLSNGNPVCQPAGGCFVPQPAAEGTIHRFEFPDMLIRFLKSDCIRNRGFGFIEIFGLDARQNQKSCSHSCKAEQPQSSIHKSPVLPPETPKPDSGSPCIPRQCRSSSSRLCD